MPRKSRSNVRHAIPRILNARLFSDNFRSNLVRTDGTYIDLEDLFNLLFSAEYAKRLLSTWRCKCNGGVNRSPNLRQTLPLSLSLPFLHASSLMPRLADFGCVLLACHTRDLETTHHRKGRRFWKKYGTSRHCSFEMARSRFADSTSW